ncbi:MAG: dockerin type I repeat-containing protein [Clostridia bacterium]|nr:dockerin type I repeat-containing protein [Clostridia bacterium]
MKKFLSMLLATAFTLTAFGVTAIFGGFISAGAAEYEYYRYESLPGYSIFTDEELAQMTNTYTKSGYNETIEGVGPVVTYEITKSGGWMTVYHAKAKNMQASSNQLHEDLTDMSWAALDTVGNKTFLGDMTAEGYADTVERFAEQDGISFWVGVDGQPFTSEIGIVVLQCPSTGPYYTMTLDDDTGDHTAEEIADYGIGFRYSSVHKRPDADGYVHFDFRTDFHQADWWSTDDYGENLWKKYGESNIPYQTLPEKIRPLISGMSITFFNVGAGQKASIGDMKMYIDTRIHTDELDELMMQYDSLDPEAFTESSYEAATEAYLEGYEVMNDDNIGEHYSQKQINRIAKKLKEALMALQPMFKVRSATVAINGFDVLTDGDLDEINDGGNVYDAAMLTDEFVPEGSAVQSVYVIGGAFDGDPSYGWSMFSTSKLNDDDEVEAVNNVFGADNLDESAGLSFWIKYGENYTPAPTSMAVGVGSSTDGVYFECDPADVQLPESEGYVGIAWNSFWDYDGEEDIYDYLASLDYITFKIEGCYQKEFYLSDLHAFEWSINSADFTAMDERIVGAENYLATLNKDDWSVRSWQRVEQAIDAARALHDEYAVTQQDVDKATDWITRTVNWLTLRGDNATQDEIDALEAAYFSAKSYWRGNYTGRSYVNLKAAIDEVSEYINDELSSAACNDLTGKLNTAIAGLVPITHSGFVAPTQATDSNGKPVTVKLFSLEDFSGNRDFNKANGHRRENVGYDLVTSSTSVTLPAKALRMTAQADLSSKHTDEHGAMQFKLADKICHAIHPEVITEDGNHIGGSIGDLRGSAGIRIWVGVNDMNLAKDAFFRFGVSNIEEGPYFENHAVNIPFPASGSGWLYIPWECFDYYDEWTGGKETNLTEIRFIIIRVDGVVPQGLEVYATCVAAYVEPVNSVNATPVVTGVTDGQTVDVAGGSVAPKWDVGTATLKVGTNAKYYVAGTPITENGDYTLTVTNGDKQTEVSFTVTGGTVADVTPTVTGVANNGSYSEPVTINWDVGTATLNGDAFEKGTTVSEPGDYLLEVVNGTKSVSVRFTITGEEPPAVKKGDMDGDGEITVNDALKALRIAARLAESTPEALEIGDVDGDGDITVNDALKILRVAAKLADESSLG